MKHAEYSTLVLERTTGRALYDPGCVLRVAGGLRDEAGRPIASAALEGSLELVRYEENGDARTASLVALPEAGWTVVTSTDLDEFTSPEGRIRAAWLMLVLFMALATAGVGVILITYVMRSLEQVSAAAGRIGEGDFSPWLPPP